jgi:hypothetical protein
MAVSTHALVGLSATSGIMVVFQRKYRCCQRHPELAYFEKELTRNTCSTDARLTKYSVSG